MTLYTILYIVITSGHRECEQTYVKYYSTTQQLNFWSTSKISYHFIN